MVAALQVSFVQVLLGFVVAAGSALIAGSSLWTVVRRHRAEEHFLKVLSDSMRVSFTRDKRVLVRAKDGELTAKDKEDLRGVISGALSKLGEPTDKDAIEKALKQPSPRGRENYERKILSEGARRALQGPETSDAAVKDSTTARDSTTDTTETTDAVSAPDASAHEEEAEGVIWTSGWFAGPRRVGRFHYVCPDPLGDANRAFASKVNDYFAFALGLPRSEVDVIRRDDDLVVRAELPGETFDKTNITIQDNLLTISLSEKGEIREAPVPLPQHVDEDDVSTRFKDGVLEVTIKGATPRAPIPGYDEMSEAEISKRLNDLSAEELRLVRDYEERNKKREALLKQMDRKIRA